MKMRLATNAEILARYPAGRRVSFDAYVRDVYDPRTETGVRRVGRGSSKVREIDGIPHVRRHGRLERLYGTHCDIGICAFISLLTIVAPRTGAAA